MDALMQQQWREVKDVFGQLLSVPPAEREAFIDAAALSAASLAALRKLLTAAAASGEFLERPAALLLDATPAPLPDRLQPGFRIGDYRVIGLLGRGGTGEVYLAERADGLYEQKVAVKRLRIEAAQEGQRFGAERQILARLEHPAIARLLDAGLDADSRPYTVVEYVQGTGFLEHCAQLSLDQRLDLFLQICDAVAYAHTQLVIHRDIKPGNLMVTASGRVKLLDFGVAQLLDTGSFSGGLHGASQALLLAPFTPDYAAPEQIEGKAVGTATDVYALGVLLFELLTGRRPWSVSEMPLTLAVERLLHQIAPAASAAAVTSALARRLAGDLDAIIAKALSKEPQQRYATVDALAEDLRRHRRGEPVSARSGVRGYVAGRFLKRHRWSIAAAAFVALALLGALIGYAVHRQRQAELRLELAQRELRRGDAINDFLALLIRSAAPGGEPLESNPQQLLQSAAQRVFQQYQDRPSDLADMVLQLGDLFIAADNTEAAAPMLEQYLERYGAQAEPADVAEIRNELATVSIRRGDTARAAALLAEAQAFWNRDPDRYRDELLGSRLNQASIERSQGDVERAVGTLRAALAERLQAPQGRETSLVIYQNLAGALTAANRPDEAARTFVEGWAQFQAVEQTRTPEALSFLNSWAVYASNRGSLDEAERRYRECVALRRQLYGESVQLAAPLSGLARVLALRAQVEEALPLLAQARDIAARYAGAKSPVVLASWLYEIDANLLLDKLPEAEAALLRARETAQGQYGPEHVLSARLDEAEGRLRQAQERYAEAAQKFSDAEAVFRKTGTSAIAFLAQTLVSHGELALLRGHAAEALPLLEEAAALRNKVAAPGTWLRAEADGALGEALIETGQPARGLPLLRAAVSDLQRELGGSHPVTLRMQQRLR
jgi:hypothetical protein